MSIEKSNPTPDPPDGPPPHAPIPDAERAYGDLHDSAHRLLRRERKNHTLTPTALVNEAFLRLARQRRQSWDSRAGFLAAATGMMKRVLSNYGRDRKALKRGGGRARAAYDEEQISGADGGSTSSAVREALERLKEHDPRAAEIAELRLYRGLPNETIAETLGASLRTVERDWAAARAWLRAELSEEERVP